MIKVYSIGTVAALIAACTATAIAEPTFVFHGPTSQVFGETAGITMREPSAPREGELVDLWIEVGYSFDYQNIAVYYTTDGSTPNGGFGTGDGTTQVLSNLNGGVTFVRNQFDGNANRNKDWWKATLPASARAYGQNIRYKIGTWGNGPQKFTNGANTSSVANEFTFSNLIAWPGRGAGNSNPSVGYPEINFWKEEAVFGNTFCAGMLDRNGSVYDFHFPTVGGVGGVGTKNEGYFGGVDTFPPGLPTSWRGQMHINQATAGIRVDGTTHWLSNRAAASYSNVTQEYLADSNTIRTTQTLTANGNNISVEQFDFAPMAVAFPNDNGGEAQKHIYIKRMLLTNNGPTKNVNVYWYVDPALNGGDNYDGMFVDRPRGAMVMYDNTFRVVTGTGLAINPPNEYNPTTFAGYEKNKSLYLTSAMKVLASNGTVESSGNQFWADTSADQGQGWQGVNVTLQQGQTREVVIMLAGAVDNTANMTGTYNFKLANVMDWFYSSSAQSIQLATDNHWSSWVNGSLTIDTPDESYDSLFKRGLLATALHVDGVNGGIIAGFHNGAYPYVWPRDAVYGAVTLARAGHLDEAAGVYQWMKNTAFRDFDCNGRKGFWKQKYSTDGYVIWGAPQIDETAVFPWGIKFQYDMTGSATLLQDYVEQVRDSVWAMTNDSCVDNRLRFEEGVNLSYSMNVWEDSFDVHIYSNANIVRGLNDAASIFDFMGLGAEALQSHNLANQVKGGLDARLDWNGENTDISQLGIAYPFNVYAYNDARVNRVMDRINGVATDRFGNNHPLMNFNGEHAGLLNRYHGDNYWNGGPWFLSSLWYGLFYGERQDLNAGTGDVDNMKLRLDLLIDRLGPAGLGAEQIAFSNSYLYPGGDFTLQTAWPNAWESMSTFADSLMKFMDMTPQAWANKMIFEPKLPSAWDSMSFNNITMVHSPSGNTHKIRLDVSSGGAVHTFTNTSGFPLNLETYLRSNNAGCLTVLMNGAPVPFTFDEITGRVHVVTQLTPSLGAVDVIQAVSTPTADYNQDGGVDGSDVDAFFADWVQGNSAADFNFDGGVDGSDVDAFFAAWVNGGCA